MHFYKYILQYAFVVTDGLKFLQSYIATSLTQIYNLTSSLCMNILIIIRGLAIKATTFDVITSIKSMESMKCMYE